MGLSFQSFGKRVFYGWWTFFTVHLLAAVLFFILHRRSPQKRYLEG
ncbi:MAG: hypothetical protein NTX30_06005 [Deltaproteobacteria bacterium]|nr:hypothetical protein [Deltaproteobacteria bacterium]